MQNSDSQVIQGQEALNFIKDAFAEMNGEEISPELSEEAKILVFNAT